MIRKVTCAECYLFDWDGETSKGECGGRIRLRKREILAKKSRVCGHFLYKEQSVGVCEECGQEVMLDPGIDSLFARPCPDPDCAGSVRMQ